MSSLPRIVVTRHDAHGNHQTFVCAYLVGWVRTGPNPFCSPFPTATVVLSPKHSFSSKMGLFLWCTTREPSSCHGALLPVPQHRTLSDPFFLDQVFQKAKTTKLVLVSSPTRDYTFLILWDRLGQSLPRCDLLLCSHDSLAASTDT